MDGRHSQEAWEARIAGIHQRHASQVGALSGKACADWGGAWCSGGGGGGHKGASPVCGRPRHGGSALSATRKRSVNRGLARLRLQGMPAVKPHLPARSIAPSPLVQFPLHLLYISSCTCARACTCIAGRPLEPHLPAPPASPQAARPRHHPRAWSSRAQTRAVRALQHAGGAFAWTSGSGRGNSVGDPRIRLL